MPKQTKRRARPQRKTDPTTRAAALERAKLRRAITARQELARLAGQLRRATERSDRALVELMKWIAVTMKPGLLERETPAATEPRGETPATV